MKEEFYTLGLGPFLLILIILRIQKRKKKEEFLVVAMYEL